MIHILRAAELKLVRAGKPAQRLRPAWGRDWGRAGVWVRGVGWGRFPSGSVVAVSTWLDHSDQKVCWLHESDGHSLA